MGFSSELACADVTDRGARERPRRRRSSITYDLHVRGRSRIHVTLGRYADGRLCELFVNASKTGSDVRTAYECWAMTASKALQHGLPARELARAIRSVRDGSGGVITSPPHLAERMATSIWDALAQLIETA